MNLIGRFVEILEESKCRCDQSIAGDFQVTEQINGDMNDTPNLLAHGDNGRFMKYLSKDKAMDGKLKLIYIDPPFFSKATYDAVVHLKSKDGKKLDPIRYFAYDDTWQRDMTEYLKMLCYRLYLMKDLLADDGTIWIHLDWHVVHYAKIFLDEIFGEENFVNPRGAVRPGTPACPATRRSRRGARPGCACAGPRRRPDPRSCAVRKPGR